MKRCFLLLILILMTFCLVSCDFLRSIAGRPCSDEISERREMIEMEKAAESEAARQAEIAARHSADSADALRKLRESGCQILSQEKLPGLEQVSERFFIALGSFSQKGNAELFADKVRSSGYPVRIVPYRSGRSLVAACPTDDPVELMNSFGKLKEELFCPADAWIFMKSE